MTDQTQVSLSESRRTVVYAIVAGLSVSMGIYTYLSNQPKQMKEFEKVGEEFYPEFTRTDDADSLFVAKYFEKDGVLKTFEVAQKDGRWRIPSHYNYPADAKEQLAKTAVSIMGIRREAVISRRAADHEKLGVVDPLSEEVSDRKGRGERITIKKGDEVLADYIIGKPYPGHPGEFYVRAPDEKETYVTHIDVDLSTRFQDWIDTDLLKIDRSKLTDILVKKYSIDEQARQFKDRETVELTREKFGTPWIMLGLDEETEEVNHDAVKDLASTLVDLEVLGVRPKPPGLSSDLKWDPRFNQIERELIAGELAQKGFLLAEYQDGSGMVLLAQEGSFSATTSEGINYELLFGNVFTGDLNEIEIGKPDDQEEAAEQEASGDSFGKKDQAGNDTESTAPENDAAAKMTKEDKKQQQSRYLFVKVTFDSSALGPEPTPPEPPQDPGPFDPNAPLAAPRPGEPSLSPQEKFKQDQILYEADLKQFEQAEAAYQKKLEDGRKKAEELSNRLGAWYYVVPAVNIEALRVSRAELVQPKGTDAKKEAAQRQSGPGANSFQLPTTPSPLQIPDQN